MAVLPVKMGERTTIKDIFVQCQTGMQSHGKLISTLTKIYDKTEFATFWSEFSHYLKYAMIIFKREPAVERVIDFVAKFVPALSKKTQGEGDDGSDDDHDDVSDNKMLQEMFDFLLQCHSAKDRGVRFRCCQLINKLLTNLGEEAQIDDELYDRLYECMLERLKDKWPVVRYHAVMAMSRLQDPSDENCPVIKAYLFLLNCDPNPDVRRAVLTSIAPSTKTLSSIIGRTRDVKDTVRKAAYEVLSEKIHIKALSIALRLQLVNEGLNDRSEMVKQACSGKLLQAWLRTFGGNILDVLKSLDVEDSTDVCSLVLETLFKTGSPQDLVEKFDILSESLLIPMDQLTCESALYWQALCKYFHGMGNDGDEFMEKVLPTCVDYCSYVQSYIDDLKNVDDPEIQLSREFIIEHLLMIASYMDTADQASRKALETLLHNMLMAEHVSHRLVKMVVVRICEIKGTSDAMIPYLAETVSEIREPITVVAKDIAAEERRQINLKVASVRVQLNQLREDLDEAVKSQDFSKANTIKTQIAELDAEKVRLLESTESATEEIRTERNDPQTILKCQTIISEMLQIFKLSGINPTLQMMIESQILPGIQNEDADVRNMAMQALGLCCYLSKDLLVSYIPLFMQASQIDVEGVRVTALQVLFDLLHIYGLEIVDANDGSSDENASSVDSGETNTSENKNSEKNGAASKLVAIICSFLDGENSELRTCAAEGLAKLLLSGRVVSSKILSHLILLWYNPLSEDDTHLRDCLGTFFPLYALAGRSNQEVVEEAFIPTLKTLLNAPATSPLAEVDVNNVAELLVQLTNTKLITQNQNSEEKSQDNPGHDNLSEKVCNEILSNPDSFTTKLWVKILNQMEVSPDNEVVLKDLRILCYKMVKLVKDKPSLKSLQKFQATVNEMASKFVTNDDDLENIEIEPVAVEQQDGEDTEEDQTEDTVPRKKRVRRLHTQNLTLGLDSESELDITQGEAIDVDASCLERRTSTLSTASETPSRRSRKNTTSSVVTEVAADEDVFSVPDVPVARKRISVEPRPVDTTQENDESETDKDQDEGDREKSAVESEEPVVILKDVFKPSGTDAESETEKKTPEKQKSSTRPDDEAEPQGKKKTKQIATAANVKRKTPTKDKEGALVNGEDLVDGESQSRGDSNEARSPRRSLEKRKPRGDSDADIPAKSPKRVADKSPSKGKDAEAQSPRRSLEKRKSKGEVSEVPSKSPRRASDKSPVASSKTPQKSKEKEATTKSPKRATSKSPVKSPSKHTANEADKKSPRKASAKSPEKSTLKNKDEKTSAKSLGRQLEKRKPKLDSEDSHAKSPRIGSNDSPKKRPGTSAAGGIEKEPRKNVKSSSREEADTGKRTGNTLSKAGVERPDTRRAGSRAVDKAPEPVSVRTVRNVRSKSTTEVAKSPRNVRTMKAVKDIDDSKSPRPTRKSVSQMIVSATQGAKSPRPDKRANSLAKVPKAAETKSPRPARRASSHVVLDTPEPKSPSSLRNRPQRSIAETPEVKSPKPTRKPDKTTVDIAENKTKAQEKDVAKAKEAITSKTRGVTKSASSSKVSPVSVRATRTGRGKAGTSSDESSAVSSPEAPAAKKKKLVQPVQARREKPAEESEEEEDQLRRKAKPSRKSSSASSLKLPSAQTGRATPTRKEPKSSQEGGDSKKTRETSANRKRGSIVSTPSTLSSRASPSSTSSSQTSQSGTRLSTRRSAVDTVRATPRSQQSESDQSGSVFSSPGSAAPRTRSSLAAAGDHNTRSTHSKAQDVPKQNLEKKLRDAGKRAMTKTLPSKAKTARK